MSTSHGEVQRIKTDKSVNSWWKRLGDSEVNSYEFMVRIELTKKSYLKVENPMSKVIIYHNPDCTKSKQALELLKNKKVDHTIKEYLKEGLGNSELMSLINLLGESWQSIVRVKEGDFLKAPFDINDPAVVAFNLVKNPRLLERPIIVFNSSALIARPFSKLEEVFADL